MCVLLFNSCPLVSGKLLHRLRQGVRLSLVLNLFLTFHKISDSCSYKILRTKEECISMRFFDIVDTMGVAMLQPRPYFQR